MTAKFQYKKSEITKDAIFETAKRLINEKGFENVTVSEIAQEANVAKGTFYYYFKSKEDIIIYTYQVADETYRASYDMAKDIPEFTESIKVFLCEAYSRMQEFGKEIISTSLTNSLTTSINQFMRGRILTSYLELIYEKGIETGELTDMDFDYFWRRTQSFLIGVEYAWCVNDNNLTLVDYLVEGLDVFLYGIVNAKRQPSYNSD